MFSFFKRDKGTGDPLSDPNSIIRWIQELPAGDIYSTQNAVVAKLLEFNQSQNDCSAERLAVLIGLDERCRDMQFALCTQYLVNPHMSRVFEARLWKTIHSYFFEVARGYHAFLMHFIADPASRKLHAKLPLITARAQRALADVIKWRHFHFERIDEKLWLRMHNLYRMAEFNGFQHKKVQVYPADRRPSSCHEEYLQALLLSPLGNGKLLPRQLDKVDRWLDEWAALVTLDSQFLPNGHCFYVDTGKGQGMRHLRNPVGDTACRFISTAALRKRIDQTLAALQAGKTAVSLGLGEDFRFPEDGDLLALARSEWSPLSSRERRRMERQPKSGSWEIVRDLPSIISTLGNPLPSLYQGNSKTSSTLTTDEILDIKIYGFVRTSTSTTRQKQAESAVAADQRARWIQTNASGHGLGFLLGTGTSSWVKAGYLLAMRDGDVFTPWQVGVTRRVEMDDKGQRIVGVEVLAGGISVIDLEHETLQHEPEIAADGYEVHDTTHVTSHVCQALLHTPPAGAQAILLSPAHYAQGRRYIVRLPDTKTQLVQLDKVLDKGQGWVSVAYKVLAPV